MISITETIAVPRPRERVWEVISSPADVVSCIAGAELGEAHEDGSFDGTLMVKFGAVRVRFGARVHLDLDEAEFEGRLTARGKDGQAATRFTADASFRVIEDGSASKVVMDGEIQLTGKLTSLIEAGAGVVVSRMTRDFSARLIELCAAPAAPAAPVAPAPTRPTTLTARIRALWAALWRWRSERSSQGGTA
ncbi:SRPBCC domain-containing protein [Actinomadura citrea]|uniref:Carbon monoxide dehydrogenase subunit G n=1 Tax=Actinomadura citrea TaxID=46158 RepID=A0A7Y9GE59_9ACTN|nr:SRPBCC domain-containing protein [Actinomadura citrea]NYE14893.1 carbon monoxide dehydrogenase subunit G [Actinomadura citrea]GGU08591.1 hypothetical protein GCM10010177_79670 [Actinomadura citrea]